MEQSWDCLPETDPPLKGLSGGAQTRQLWPELLH